MLITTIALWGKTFFFSNGVVESDAINMPLYQVVLDILGENSMLRNIIAFSLLAIQSLVLVALNKRYEFINYHGYLYVLIFFFVSSGMAVMQQLTPLVFANLFFLLALALVLSSFQKTRVLPLFFNTGILLNIATLFYAGMIFYIIILWVALIIIRGLDLREIIVLFLGYLTPFVLIVGYTYVFSSLEQFNFNLSQISYSIDYNNKFVIGYSSVLLLLLLISIVYSYVNNTIKISSRKYIQILLSIVWITPAVYFLIPFVSYEILVIMAVPASFLITQYLVSSRANLWTEFVFDGLFIILVLLQIYG